MSQKCKYGEHFQAHGGNSSEVKERNESSQILVRRFVQINLSFSSFILLFVWGLSSEYIHRAGK